MDYEATAAEAERLFRMEGNCGRLLRRFLARLRGTIEIPATLVPPELQERAKLVLQLRQYDLAHFGAVDARAMGYRKGKNAALVFYVPNTANLTVRDMREVLRQVGHFCSMAEFNLDELRERSASDMRRTLRQLAQSLPLELQVQVQVQARARAVIARARADLGSDLGGSLTDLLLDNLPELKSVHDARVVLAAIGESI